MLQNPWTDEERACRSLLGVMGVRMADDSRASLPGPRWPDQPATGVPRASFRALTRVDRWISET